MGEKDVVGETEGGRRSFPVSESRGEMQFICLGLEALVSLGLAWSEDMDEGLVLSCSVLKTYDTPMCDTRHFFQRLQESTAHFHMVSFNILPIYSRLASHIESKFSGAEWS